MRLVTAWLTPGEYRQMHENLHWLEGRHALAGIAEVIRQRRFQIEQGHTPAHDREAHDDGALVQMAAGRLSDLSDSRLDGLADPATDEMTLAQAGALAAAEIDRLTEFDPPEPEPATYRCWRVPGGPGVSGVTHHVHGPGQPCPLGFGP
jgi:hypothetical protein